MYEGWFTALSPPAMSNSGFSGASSVKLFGAAVISRLLGSVGTAMIGIGKIERASNLGRAWISVVGNKQLEIASTGMKVEQTGSTITIYTTCKE